MATTLSSARVVLGHVAPVPWVSPEAALSLTGKSITDASGEGCRRRCACRGQAPSAESVQNHPGKGRGEARNPECLLGRRCRMMLNLDSERFDTGREELCSGTAMEGTIH